MRYLYRICGHLALIPRSLEIKVHYNRGEYPLCDGGFADVWKCRYDGKEVAAKVLKVYSTSDFEQIRKVGYSQHFVGIDKLTMSWVEVLQGGYDVEGPSPPERIAAARCDDNRESVRDDIRVDGKW